MTDADDGIRARIAAAAERREQDRQDRAEFAEARRHGLAKRHQTKLHRMKGPAMADRTQQQILDASQRIADRDVNDPRGSLTRPLLPGEGTRDTSALFESECIRCRQKFVDDRPAVPYCGYCRPPVTRTAA